jgi:hypothetical protein
MIYRLVEYYADELADWNRILTFLKAESDGFERRLAAALEKKNIIPGEEKERGKLLDLFLVQHQRFDFIQKEIESQQHRLSHNTPVENKLIENPIASQQNTLRARMHGVEKDFLRIKYSGYLFLSSFLKT